MSKISKIKLYLVTDETGKVIGSQATPGTIDNPRYIEVDQETYNQFGQLAPYETLTFDQKAKTFTHHPDLRPVFKIAAERALSRMEQSVGIALTRDDEAKDTEHIIEYERPDGSVGLVKAVFVKGQATLQITPTVSGYYHFRGSDTWKPEEEVSIAVVEE